MPVIRAKDIRALSLKERQDKLLELKEELMHERGVASMGGAPQSPGRIRAVRKSISRLLTIMREAEIHEEQKALEKKVKSPKKKVKGEGKAEGTEEKPAKKVKTAKREPKADEKKE